MRNQRRAVLRMMQSHQHPKGKNRPDNRQQHFCSFGHRTSLSAPAEDALREHTTMLLTPADWMPTLCPRTTARTDKAMPAANTHEVAATGHAGLYPVSLHRAAGGNRNSTNHLVILLCHLDELRITDQAHRLKVIAGNTYLDRRVTAALIQPQPRPDFSLWFDRNRRMGIRPDLFHIGSQQRTQAIAYRCSGRRSC